MALNTSKPGIISEIDRALANALGLQALFLFQEPSGYIRDSVTETGAALSSGGVAIDQPGLVLTFNGSQAQNLAFALPVPGTGALPAAAQNFVIMARFKPTGAPAATPGQIFGICASAGTQGAFGVGTDTSNNVGQTWLSGSGAGIGAYSPGVLNEWYTVYAALSGTNGAEQLAWINGVPATSNQGSSTSSGGAGTMNEIVFGAQHRSSGFLRQAKGNLEWAAILYNPQPIMTDQLAAELFAADFPYNLLLGTKRRALWKSSGGGTVINLAARSSLAARARAPLTGVAALKGHSVASLHGTAKASGSTALKAHSSLAIDGKAAATYVAALHTHGVVSVHGSAKASGTTQLKGRGSTALRSRTTLASGLILLASRTLLALRGKAKPSAAAALHARSGLALQAKAKASGAVSLKARTTTQVKARAPMLPAIFLKARGLVGLRGAAKASGTARLAAKTTVAVQSRASLSSGVRLLAGRSLVVLRALSALLLGKLDPTRRYTLLASPWRYTALHPPLSYVLLMPGNATMPALRDLPPIDATVQLQTIAVDFGQFLPSGVTLMGTPTVTISVHSGTDSNPSSRLSGAPQVGTVPSAQGGSGVANTAVLQQFQNLLGGVTYLIEMSCTRSDGDVASGWTHVAGVTPT